MSAESMVFDALRLDPTVAALIAVDEEGNASEPRIFPDVAPQEFSWPLIVFARSGTVPIYTIGDELVLTDVTMNVTCWGRTRPEAEVLADATVEAMRVAGHLFLDRRAGFDAETEGYAAAVDFNVTE